MEILIGAGVALAMVALRVPLTAVGDRVPYPLNFTGVVIAAVFAGWRSGLIALVLGQALVWYAVVSPSYSMQTTGPDQLGGLVLATVSEALVLTIIGLYQREVDKGMAEREGRLALLDHALNEIDHRTRNNHQTVLALIHLQAQGSTNEGVKAALQQVADRIQAVAQATEKLALRSGDLEHVRLDDHLSILCKQIERGLSEEHVRIDCDFDEITTTAEKAVPIAIIVNELVTNALKHAFDGRDTGRIIVTGRMNGVLKLTVADDGGGMKNLSRSRRGGLGTKLVESFARQIRAKHEVTTSESGTRHDIIIPKVD